MRTTDPHRQNPGPTGADDLTVRMNAERQAVEQSVLRYVDQRMETLPSGGGGGSAGFYGRFRLEIWALVLATLLGGVLWRQGQILERLPTKPGASEPALDDDGAGPKVEDPVEWPRILELRRDAVAGWLGAAARGEGIGPERVSERQKTNLAGYAETLRSDAQLVPTQLADTRLALFEYALLTYMTETKLPLGDAALDLDLRPGEYGRNVLDGLAGQLDVRRRTEPNRARGDTAFQTAILGAWLERHPQPPAAPQGEGEAAAQGEGGAGAG
ncbi:MAG: hypothetical protein AAGD06_14315 [Acidobacteriota bacterium]